MRPSVSFPATKGSTVSRLRNSLEISGESFESWRKNAAMRCYWSRRRRETRTVYHQSVPRPIRSESGVWMRLEHIGVFMNIQSSCPSSMRSAAEPSMGPPVCSQVTGTGNGLLLCFRWTQEGYTYDVIDSGVGPANCLLFERDGSPVLLASNREIDEVALYEIFS